MDVSTAEQLFLFSSDNRDDQLPRTCVLAFLCHLDSSNLQHQRLMEEVAMELLKKVRLALSGSQQCVFFLLFLWCGETPGLHDCQQSNFQSGSLYDDSFFFTLYPSVVTDWRSQIINIYRH